MDVSVSLMGSPKLSYHLEVTGNGTLEVYEGTTLALSTDAGDGAQNIEHRTSNDPCNLRFVYTPEPGDTGGVILDAFDLQRGLLIIVR